MDCAMNDTMNDRQGAIPDTPPTPFFSARTIQQWGIRTFTHIVQEITSQWTMRPYHGGRSATIASPAGYRVREISGLGQEELFWVSLSPSTQITDGGGGTTAAARRNDKYLSPYPGNWPSIANLRCASNYAVPCWRGRGVPVIIIITYTVTL